MKCKILNKNTIYKLNCKSNNVAYTCETGRNLEIG